MLHSVEELRGMTIHAEDGETGKIKDVYFDDERWTVRYLEADTGGWITGRRVLLSPHSVKGIDWENGQVHIALSKKRIENAPAPETHKPVSRQHEVSMYRYFNYPFYWGGPYLWGGSALPMLADDRALDAMPGESRLTEDEQRDDEVGDIHLRSATEVEGYGIHATDDTLGEVDDFLFDERDWSIGFLVVDPRKWWPGKQVLISPSQVRSVNWATNEISVALSRKEIEESAEFDPDRPLEGGETQCLYRQPQQPSPRL